MNQTLKKQPVAFVTGASSGFGLLTSVALAREGYRVLASMRDLDKRGRLEAAAKEAGVTDRIEIIQLDVTDFSATETVIQNVIEDYGQIDLLVNNAGYAAGGFTEELAVEECARANILKSLVISLRRSLLLKNGRGNLKRIFSVW
ncbi:SDR family NAD(P)-dependent oxidoreductase [Aeribacillus sp. FSL K6-8394]|uniref:SDR family NAD(P)-dependent oxidoreductase n=1 Tax=Aeribacillus sp. FSL K6-8394 TaxID=2954570 RepID=UPI004046D4FF